MLPAGSGGSSWNISTPARASEPYISEAGPFNISTERTPCASTSTPCSSPHCCPSCLTPSLITSTRLYPSPRITGLEMPLPVVICDTPGWRAMASITLENCRVRRYSGPTTDTGAGLCLSLVVPVSPVTAISVRCTQLSWSCAESEKGAQKTRRIICVIFICLNQNPQLIVCLQSSMIYCFAVQC